MLIRIIVGQGPNTVLSVSIDGGCLDMIFLAYYIFFFSLFLGDWPDIDEFSLKEQQTRFYQPASIL